MSVISTTPIPPPEAPGAAAEVPIGHGGARVVTDEILVLNKGQVVERGRTKQVLQHPTHAYTVQLLDAVATPSAAADARQG